MSVYALVFILPVLFPLCVVWIKHAKKKITWQIHLPENSLYSSVTCLALLCAKKKKKTVSSNCFEGGLYLKSNEGCSRQIKIWKTRRGERRTLFPHRTQNNSPYHSAASKGAQSVYNPSAPSAGYFNVCSQILSRQMKGEDRSTQGWESSRWMHEWLITFLPVEPQLSTKRSLILSLKRPN